MAKRTGQRSAAAESVKTPGSTPGCTARTETHRLVRLVVKNPENVSG